MTSVLRQARRIPRTSRGRTHVPSAFSHLLPLFGIFMRLRPRLLCRAPSTCPTAKVRRPSVVLRVSLYEPAGTATYVTLTSDLLSGLSSLTPSSPPSVASHPVRVSSSTLVSISSMVSPAALAALKREPLCASEFFGNAIRTLSDRPVQPLSFFLSCSLFLANSTYTHIAESSITKT